ncbi:MAG: GNAT family N-acetyltransferase [Candidatus Izemoplasmatales bacterium]|jgi:predicted N-acetyltransferase YhbS|nr:GNAT family N-acetyltransferase [Candidatus Izemoplasmatales bacterium]MDD4355262.1 GNAT family N-acetyltransferase [Candidatus Izemoplasmatales bacterium]MDD4988317.1 GNAT family N-acetyltransferase [Candidatus Izemoplasmatales bacterium]MDY0373036.1 GNAT family N-acetyltransferase [Candidatus Izemoplasmatales bacterium]NLF48355.1 GNAT family N-acetyltransferase [Acholeplasmataceae bacterium]
MDIRRLKQEELPLIFHLIESEGDAWKDYFEGENKRKYLKVLKTSLIHVAMEEGQCIGFVRFKLDGGFGVYIHDLLVGAEFRGNNIGLQLMESVAREFPHQKVYVMSDEDGYYQKLHFKKAGSIFIVPTPQK